MQNNSISLDDSVTSDGCTDFAKQKIEIAPCSSVETQDDESEDDTKYAYDGMQSDLATKRINFTCTLG